MNGLTNGHLYEYHRQIQQLQDSVILFLLKYQLKGFYNEHGKRIENILQRRNELQKQYFVFENNQIKHEEKEGKKTPVMLEGKNYQDFLKEYNDYMGQSVGNIILHKA